MLCIIIQKKKEVEEDQEKSDASKSKTESEGLGNLGSLGAALASSLVTNALSNSHAQQGYPSQQSSNSGGGVLDSILGALGMIQ